MLRDHPSVNLSRATFHIDIHQQKMILGEIHSVRTGKPIALRTQRIVEFVTKLFKVHSSVLIQ